VEKRIALLHTVKSVLDSFEPLLRASLPGQLKVHNLLDEFLASDPAETGVFSAANLRRLELDLWSAELTGADLIAVTCSTLSPHVAGLRASFSVPVVAIDDAMCALAAGTGRRVMILATARSTVEPTTAKLLAEAKAAGREIETRHLVAEEAYAAIKRGDRARHDAIVLGLASGISGCDVVVLAQASMAHLEAEVARLCGCPTLSSPSLCVAEIGQRLFPRVQPPVRS
jgi:Asp/Glu/hydantoin racemase